MDLGRATLLRLPLCSLYTRTEGELDTRFSYGGTDMPKMQPKGYTDHLNRKPAENICHGFDYAAFIDRPLNNYVVLNLHGESVDEAATIFEKVRHKFRDWFNRRTKQLYGHRLPPAYVYTLEQPGQQAHANWVVNIPPRLQKEFAERLERWASKAQRRKGEFDIHLEPVVPGTAKTLAKYVIKGTDEMYVGYLHLQEFAAPQGRIWGRRAGTSPSISRSARKDAGFVAKRDRNKRQALAAA